MTIFFRKKIFDIYNKNFAYMENTKKLIKSLTLDKIEYIISSY